MPTNSDKDARDTSKINTIIELLFFAYRDFTADPDEILSALGFGRAHHRVLHFVDRKQGLTVAELLDLLGITKQSLARVLKQLVDGNYIEQREGPNDRRQRELYLTNTGSILIEDLRRPQSRRICEALANSGHGEDDAIRFLSSMIGPHAKHQIETLE
ncbi:MarR family winged helix-turn-helix transcriptional regulator [Ahrensia marina]|jgi:DNA-binding MarR family transcriptional regulator|uniref:MarR family transcriptional regulator n=1 Tax=Ahrensia marina TaxID=1514904 RepID=A0A0N0E8Z8_9HYPH|nr:MarR family transcriptional regulator [Ahrensia marina]KPB02945.1 MarR family transcriptional regulator [Ahrensia marina]